MSISHRNYFVHTVCPSFSRWRKYNLFISSANISIGIVFTNTSTALSDTGLKPVICLIALRRYTEDSFLLVVPTKNFSNHIVQGYNIIEVTTIDIILILNGRGP